MKHVYSSLVLHTPNTLSTAGSEGAEHRDTKDQMYSSLSSLNSSIYPLKKKPCVYSECVQGTYVEKSVDPQVCGSLPFTLVASVFLVAGIIGLHCHAQLEITHIPTCLDLILNLPF